MQSRTAVVTQRIVLGIFAIAILVVVFLFDRLVALWAANLDGLAGELLRRGSIVPALFSVVLFQAATEMNKLLIADGVQPFQRASGLMTIALFLLPWLASAGVLGDTIADREGLFWPLVGVFASVVLVATLCVLRRDPNGAILNGAATLFSILYLGFLGSFGLQLRCCTGAAQSHGAWLLLIVILVTKCSDIGGYLVGSALGRHKLILSISPGKTIEGAVGGLLASGAAALLLASLGRLESVHENVGRFAAIVEEMSNSLGRTLTGSSYSSMAKVLLFGILISLAAQIGDLFESCFKRDAGIKDSGSIMPHYGGVLDLVDSPLFALPVAWFLLTRIWYLG